MLQIIIWILCLYLVVKSCELLSMDTDQHKLARPVATVGAIIALVGAGGFFWLTTQQVRESNKAQEQLNFSLSNFQR